MSGSGWVPRIAGEEPSNSDGFTYCGYIPPGYSTNRTNKWRLPEPATILGDIEARGGQVDILLEDILNAYAENASLTNNNRNYRILLGAIVLSLRSDSVVQLAWEETRKAAEQTSCLAAEARMDQMIENDSYRQQAPALIKFKLERRDARFNSKNKPVDEGELAAIAELQRKIDAEQAPKR